MTNYIVANWKMNLGVQQSLELAEGILKALPKAQKSETWIGASYTALAPLSQALKTSPVSLGAQNAHWEEAGAFTGEVSVPMLREVGCSFAILGHSERRHVFGESSELVAKRFHGCLAADLTSILCIGETLEEREGGNTLSVLDAQLSPCINAMPEGSLHNVLIAYEPVWAIGTGKVASIEQIQETHAAVQSIWSQKAGSECPPILYGGSVKPDNFADIIALEAVNGALVGGASLKADSFCALVEISEAA